MKKIITLNIFLLAALSLLLLPACGGGGGGGGDSSGTSKTADDGSSAAVATLTGTVADGYLRNAQVFLDRNKNRVHDNGEPMAQSTSGGAYTLEVNPGEGELYPVVVQVIAGQTVDEDTDMPVANDYLLETLPGRWKFVSPLTTLVSLESAKNPSLSKQQAEISVRSQLGIADSVSLFTDYITLGGVDEALPAEYRRTHQAAQIVANIMGSLRVSISTNLNGQIDAAEQSLVSYMVADQILEQATLIKKALDDERNAISTVDVSELINDISGKIDTVGLNDALLTRYEQRLETPSEIWDMQPPQLQNQSPSADDSASVDTIISVTFDEPLDETLLTTGIIELSGPNGSVAGTLDYDNENIRLTFTPSQLLLPFSTYQVSVNEELADTLGNPLRGNIDWEFTTIFDQVPPALPIF